MKLIYRVHSAVLIFLSLIVAGAVSAQSPDLALVNSAASAFENTLSRSSFRIESQSITELSRGQNTSFQQSGTSGYDVARTETGWNVSGSSTTSMTTPNGSFDSTISLIVIDGAVYIKNDGGAGFAPPGASETESAPEGWFEVGANSPDSQTPNQLFAGTTMNADSALGALLLPISAESVTAIAELPADTIDGQSMRVIQLSLDSQVVLDSGAAALFSGGMGRGGFFSGGGASAAGGGFPGGQNEDGTPAFTPPDGATPGQGDSRGQGFRQALDAADVSITFAVYIGADDGLLHRIYSVTDVRSSSANGESTARTTAVVNYSAFDEPVEISAPAA